MALRKKNLEMTDSGSGSTTKAEDQKKPKTPTVQQTSTNRTNPARTTASAAAQTTTEPEKVRYTKANYRYEATDTGGGYEKNQIVYRHPYLPVRVTENWYQQSDQAKILTQEEFQKKEKNYAVQASYLDEQIASSEERIEQQRHDWLSVSGRLYDGTKQPKAWKNLQEEKQTLQQLLDERYYTEMEYSKEIAEGLYLRGVGSVWDVVLQEQAVKDRIAANRQALEYMSTADPRRKTLELKIQQDLAQLKEAKKIASDHGIDYNDLVEYAQRLEDEEKTRQSQQEWQDVVRKNDRMMNAANWLSVPMNVAGEVTGKIADGVQAVKNSLSGEYRPVNKNSNLYYGSNMSNAIRETTRDVIHERLGDGVGGYVGEFVYDVSMGLLDSALEWGVGQIIAGSNLLPDNTKDFLEKVEQASGFVENNAELMQTYREELEDGKSPAEAFGECVKILVAEGIWNGIEKKLEGNRVVADALNSEDVNSVGNMGMVVYQSWPEDAFLDGFYADGTPGAAKRTADFYVSPSGDVIPGEYESYIGENQRNQILSQIEDQTLRSVVGQMYSKDSVIGTGSMPELIRFSEQNGLNLISESQYVRVERMYAYLTKQAYIGALSSSEKEVLKTIVAAWN